MTEPDAAVQAPAGSPAPPRKRPWLRAAKWLLLAVALGLAWKLLPQAPELSRLTETLARLDLLLLAAVLLLQGATSGLRCRWVRQWRHRWMPTPGAAA